LTEATGKFHEDNKLGEGGFGPVYKVGCRVVYDYIGFVIYEEMLKLPLT
jgi:hypothetical protein